VDVKEKKMVTGRENKKGRRLFVGPLVIVFGLSEGIGAAIERSSWPMLLAHLRKIMSPPF
jgi:hypothetical protein